MEKTKKERAGFILTIVSGAMVVCSFVFGICMLRYSQNKPLLLLFNGFSGGTVAIGVICGIVSIFLRKMSKSTSSIAFTALNCIQLLCFFITSALCSSTRGERYELNYYIAGETEELVKRELYYGDYSDSFKAGYDRELKFYNALLEVEFTKIDEKQDELNGGTSIVYEVKGENSGHLNVYENGYASYCIYGGFGADIFVWYTYDASEFNELRDIAISIMEVNSSNPVNN